MTGCTADELGSHWVSHNWTDIENEISCGGNPQFAGGASSLELGDRDADEGKDFTCHFQFDIDRRITAARAGTTRPMYCSPKQHTRSVG